MNSEERAAILGVLFFVTLFCGFWVFLVFLMGWVVLWGLVGLAALVSIVSLLVRWVERGDELHPKKTKPINVGVLIE